MHMWGKNEISSIFLNASISYFYFMLNITKGVEPFPKITHFKYKIDHNFLKALVL